MTVRRDDPSWAEARRRKTITKRLQMSAGHWEAMRAHVQACAPLEGCGLLAGEGDTVARVIPVENAARSPSRFRLDAPGQLRAFQEIEDGGWELLGVFHSHPAGDKKRSAALEGPSETDIREAAYPVVHVIWSQRAGVWQAGGYWIEGSRISEVPLLIVAPE